MSLYGRVKGTRDSRWVDFKVLPGVFSHWDILQSISAGHVWNDPIGSLQFDLVLSANPQSSVLGMQHKPSTGFDAPTSVSVWVCQPLSIRQHGSWEPEFVLEGSRVTFLSGLSLRHERRRESDAHSAGIYTYSISNKNMFFLTRRLLQHIKIYRWYFMRNLQHFLV